MGLHLVKIQVDSLGGKIEVESKMSNGIIFEKFFKTNHIVLSCKKTKQIQ